MLGSIFDFWSEWPMGDDFVEEWAQLGQRVERKLHRKDMRQHHHWIERLTAWKICRTR